MDSVFRVLCSLLLFLFILSTTVIGYEKTLRKIVRNQSKMVQTPFSENRQPIQWNTSPIQVRETNPFNGVSPKKTMYHNLQGPKISALSSRTTSTFTKLRLMNTFPRNERLTRNSSVDTNQTIPKPKTKPKPKIDMIFASKSHEQDLNAHMTVKNFYQIPIQSKYFPSVDDRDENLNQRNNEENAILPEPSVNATERRTLHVKDSFVPKTEQLNERDPVNDHGIMYIDPHDDKTEVLIDILPEDREKMAYNFSIDQLSCQGIKEIKVDVDAQEHFAQFSIEPMWIGKHNFWNKIFEIRYESLMRNPEWPPLKVILIPRVHVDTIWKKTFEQYHKESVSKILTNIVKKLHFYDRLTFNWNEVSHLSHWWKTVALKTRSAIRKLVKGGRLEITTGGWVEPDEATTHLFGLTHQLIEGHQWLKLHLNYTPKAAWLTNTVAHSPTIAYLLSISDIDRMVFTNLHFSWAQYLAEFQYSDFIWLQNWDHNNVGPTKLNEESFRIGSERFPKHAVLAHYLQYNSDGFSACGPESDLCAAYNFANTDRNLDINSYNVKDKAERLLEQYSKTGTTSQHNTVIAPLGESYSYELQAEFDYQYNNYLRLAEFVNYNKDLYKATIEFGTTEDYFKNTMGKKFNYPTIKGDFLNFADTSTGHPAYWAGYYTSRPFIKILLRRLESTLRTTEILFSFASNLNVFRGYNLTTIYEILQKSRQSVARLLDRNVVSGTVSANALKYVHNQIVKTVKDCWSIQEITASFLTLKPETSTPYLQKYVYREGEFISVFKTISPGDQFYIFNSLSHERTEVVDIVTRFPNIRIIDYEKRDVIFQLNPIWKFNSDNLIKLSRKFFKVSFAVTVPAMTLALYTIKTTYDASHSAATIYCLVCIVDEAESDTAFPFNVQPIQSGDIQLESYKHRLIFDELTGFLKTVTEKQTNLEKTIFMDYGAFKDSNFNSGMFVMNTNITKPLHDILGDYRTGKQPIVMLIISGQVSTELITIYGKLLQHTTKILNLVNSPLSNAIYIESKVDYEASPKNRELEMFLSIQTDISNGNPPQIFTDNNGFQYTPRILNISRRIESNIYPITTMAFIQDNQSRLTFITDHAQGVTALQEGQLVVMLERRVLFNDGRGTDEGLADSTATFHRYYILLENLINSSYSPYARAKEITLPSFNAINLANTINYITDVFVIEKNFTDLPQHIILPLTKICFPCDVGILNYRIIFNKVNLLNFTPISAIMILHRQTYSCQVSNSISVRCQQDSTFSIEKLVASVKAVYKTNLAGTNQGEPLFNFNLNNFPPMELMTLRIDF